MITVCVQEFTIYLTKSFLPFLHCQCSVMVTWTGWQLGVALSLSPHQWNGSGSDIPHFQAGAYILHASWNLNMVVT